MKNTKTNAAKRFSFLAIIVLMAVIGFSFIACDNNSDNYGDGGGGGAGGGGDGDAKGGDKIDYTTNDIYVLAAWLKNQPSNAPGSPYIIKLKINDLTDLDLLSKMLDEAGRYVYLDLSESVLTTIPEYAFFYQYKTGYKDNRKGCAALTGITIPNSVTSFGEWAFAGCTSLASVTIPDSVTSIGDYAFRNCTSLTSVTIGNSVTSIWSYAFAGCTSLTSVIIPNSVTSIGDRAFYGCFSLASVTIPDSVTSIGGWAFDNTAWFNNQPNGVVYVGKFAYKYKGTMPANTSIVLLNGTKGIVGDAFSYCTSLTSVTIPNSVTSIGNYAFNGCTSLASVTIPNSVTSIGEQAFYYCTSLTSVTIPIMPVLTRYS